MLAPSLVSEEAKGRGYAQLGRLAPELPPTQSLRILDLIPKSQHEFM